jgi:hypothetical protein
MVWKALEGSIIGAFRNAEPVRGTVCLQVLFEGGRAFIAVGEVGVFLQ